MQRNSLDASGAAQLKSSLRCVDRERDDVGEHGCKATVHQSFEDRRVFHLSDESALGAWMWVQFLRRQPVDGVLHSAKRTSRGDLPCVSSTRDVACFCGWELFSRRSNSRPRFVGDQWPAGVASTQAPAAAGHVTAPPTDPNKHNAIVLHSETARSHGCALHAPAVRIVSHRSPFVHRACKRMNRRSRQVPLHPRHARINDHPRSNQRVTNEPPTSIQRR